MDIQCVNQRNSINVITFTFTLCLIELLPYTFYLIELTLLNDATCMKM